MAWSIFRRSSRLPAPSLQMLLIFAVVTVLCNTILLQFLDHPSLEVPLGETLSERLSPAVGKRSLRRPPRMSANTTAVPYGSCAILLFGLPRAFQQYVLPSLIKNAIRPNKQYGCDYFVHYYHIFQEVSNGRSGRGGALHPDDIQLLAQAVAEEYKDDKDSYPYIPHVGIISDTNETFWEQRHAQVMKYRNTRKADGNLTYFPYTEPTYVYPDTIDNIVKQWHSIDSVWKLMEDYMNDASAHQHVPKQKYQRVAMMRSDVVYITAIDVFELPAIYMENDETTNGNSLQSLKQQVIIPDFGKWPINDRLIIGPYDAVKIWATQRFARIDDFAKVAAPGTAMHSETFLNASILTSIKEDLQMSIYEDPWLCFLRVRADGAIWIEDCDPLKSGNGGGYPGSVIRELKPFLPQNLTCRKRFLRDKVRRIRELICEDHGPLSNKYLTIQKRLLQMRNAE